MSLFRRRKKKEVIIKYVSAQVLIRNIIYDSMTKNPEAVAQALGLSPVSEEVSEMEHRASETRLDPLHHLLPILESHAEIAGKVAAVNYAMNSDINEEELTDEVLDAMAGMFRYVSLTACLSLLTQLVEMDLIEVGHGE